MNDHKVTIAISKEPSDYFDYIDELQYLAGYTCDSSIKSVDVCPRICGLGQHSIAMVLLIFATYWWQTFFPRVIRPFALADVRNPANLDPPSHLGKVSTL